MMRLSSHTIYLLALHGDKQADHALHCINIEYDLDDKDSVIVARYNKKTDAIEVKPKGTYSFVSHSEGKK